MVQVVVYVSLTTVCSGTKQTVMTALILQVRLLIRGPLGDYDYVHWFLSLQGCSVRGQC